MSFNFDFDTMVDETYNQLSQSSNYKPLNLPTPILEIDTTRLHWKNVKDFLKTVNRNPIHFMEFMKKEFTGRDVDWVSNSKSDGLFIHGKRLKQQQINDISNKYIEMYVNCSSCKKSNTTMFKESHKRYEFECNSCGMKKYLS